MELHLKIIGIALILLSLVHIIFPKYFEWKKDLELLSLINRQMMYVHTVFIAFIVLMMGLLCLTSAEEIVGTVLGKRIAFGLFLFWALRLIIQFFGYSSKLWKGRKFETAIHVVFSIFWIYFSVVFFLVCWS